MINAQANSTYASMSGYTLEDSPGTKKTGANVKRRSEVLEEARKTAQLEAQIGMPKKK